MRQTVTNSEMGTFRTCPRKWGFEYAELLRPKLPSRVLTWGNCIHAGLEAGYWGAFSDKGRTLRLARAIECAKRGVCEHYHEYRGLLNQAVDDGMPEEIAEEHFRDADNMLDVAVWATEHFFKATQGDLEKLVLLGVEVPFTVPMPDTKGRPTGLMLSGKIDAIWWDPEMARIMVDDHKTVDELVGTTEKRIALDPQMSGYLHAAEYLVRTGQLKPLDGSTLPLDRLSMAGACRYNCIRRSFPKTPKVNKVTKNDGSIKAVGRDPWPAVTEGLKELEAERGNPLGLVSTAAIDTTAEIYGEALERQQHERYLPITDKQNELYDRLKAQGDRYFARFEFWRNAQEREDWRREVWIEAKRMRDAERLPVLRTRNAGACSMAGSMPCAYRPVCLDDEPETRALYRVAEKRHEEV